MTQPNSRKRIYTILGLLTLLYTIVGTFFVRLFLIILVLLLNTVTTSVMIQT